MDEERQPIRVAIVGLGIGQTHVLALTDVSHRYPSLGQRPRRRPGHGRRRRNAGVQPVTSRRGAGRDDVDIVDLCTPPSLHLEQITAGARRPASTSSARSRSSASLRDCDRLGRGRGGQRRRLMPIFQYRFGNGLQKVKALVDRGRRRPGVHGLGRGRLAPARRLLRRALARALGDRAGRRAAQPGRPRPRHAHLHRRPPAKVFARVDHPRERHRGGGLRRHLARAGRRLARHHHRHPRLRPGDHPAPLPLRQPLGRERHVGLRELGRPVGHPPRRRGGGRGHRRGRSTAGSRGPRAGGASSSASPTPSTRRRRPPGHAGRRPTRRSS